MFTAMNHQAASNALQSLQRDESNMCTRDHLAIFQIMILQYQMMHVGNAHN